MSLQSPTSFTATSTTASDGGAGLVANSPPLFTINSFTQNLAAVLSDSKRSRNEIHIFFTRHWGEQFVPKTSVLSAPTIPTVTLEHFRPYLATTARKHKQYLRARRALHQRQKQAGRNTVSRDEVPDVFFSPSFGRRSQPTFEAVFLEPRQGEPDSLLSLAERRKLQQQQQQTQQVQSLGRHESCGSLNSMLSMQQVSMPVEACNGRMFRACVRLQQKLEHFDDAIGALINQQLEQRNEQFWRTMHTYEALYSDLQEAIGRVSLTRQKLTKSKLELCQRSQTLLQQHYAKINRQKLLDRLQEIACLRDAQTTVQMLLNQDDVPRALECIQTAKEVLSTDLRAVNCFRHLGTQLEEMTRIIGKMLLEEFEAVIQREFAWPIEESKKRGKQSVVGNGVGDEGEEEEEEEEEELPQLHPIVFSLIRCHEFRFLAILREEISGIVKNTIKQVIKGQILEHLDSDTIGYNPATLSEHICKLSVTQWAQTLRAVTSCLSILCSKILSIQELVVKCADQICADEQQQQEQKRSRSGTSTPPNSSVQQQTNEEEEEETSTLTEEALVSTRRHSQSIELGEENGVTTVPIEKKNSPLPPGGGTPSSSLLLALPCHDVSQLRAAASQLVGHGIHACEEGVAKRIQARFKDPVLEICPPEHFHKTCEVVEEFRQICLRMDPQQSLQRSPIQTIIQQTTTKFLAKFTELRQKDLSSKIDTEPWKAATKIPFNIQQIANRFSRDCVLTAFEENRNTNCFENQQCDEVEGEEEEKVAVEEQGENLKLNGTYFIVIGSALLLIEILAGYSDLLRLFPTAGMELCMDVVQCLKLFNSRTCQLILGAGARQLVGLKTINVKHLASRSLQLISQFIPVLRQAFAERLPPDRQHFLRHFDSTARDYNDHVGEIKSKLLAMMDRELLTALEEWKAEGKAPTPQFQQIVMQIGKFYSSFSSVMPPELTTEMLHAIHANLKLYFKQNVHSRGVTPHDSIAFGMAGQDFAYYVENVRALPHCQSFPDDSINDVLLQPARKL